MADNTTPTPFSLSWFASKDDLIAAQAARITELEAELEAVGAGGVQALRSPIKTATAAPQPQVEPAINWQPLSTAPDGVRVLLGPRDNPVIGIVWQPEYWADDQSPTASVVHYNGNILVSDYRCAEWAPLPGAALATTQPVATESVLIEGVAYTIPEPVAHELLRLHIELQQSAQPAPVCEYPELPMQYACSGYFPVYSSDQMRAYADATHDMRAGETAITDFQVLAITTAYEQGVGKGREAHHRKVEAKNIYAAGTFYANAWELGYKEGQMQTVWVGEQKQVPQFRKQYCADWYDGYADHSDGGGPYEERILYTSPVATQGEQDALDVEVSAYTVRSTKVERVAQMDGTYKWAVRRNALALNKQGEWEYEPLPSRRDYAFLERCRFHTAKAAIDAALSTANGGHQE